MGAWGSWHSIRCIFEPCYDFCKGSSGGARVSGARGINHSGARRESFLSSPISLSFPLEVGPRNQAPKTYLKGLEERCKLPSGVWCKAPAPTILVHFEDVETLLITSKMCIVLRT